MWVACLFMCRLKLLPTSVNLSASEPCPPPHLGHALAGELVRGIWPLDEAAANELSQYIEASVPLVPVGVMEPEHIEQLRALGYLPLEEDAPPDTADESGIRPTGAE